MVAPVEPPDVTAAVWLRLPSLEATGSILSRSPVAERYSVLVLTTVKLSRLALPLVKDAVMPGLLGLSKVEPVNGSV